MRLLGLNISRAIAPSAEKAITSGAAGNGGWWPVIRESFPGAWQRNVTVDAGSVSSFHAFWACSTLIASDVAKLRTKLVQQDAGGVWSEFASPAYSPVLRKPNAFQNRIQFWEHWMLSKLLHGNSYVLKQRDNRNVVTELHVLPPGRTRPLVAEDGSVFYEVGQDALSGVPNAIVVPAREVIHDRWNCLFHPLVGLSPIYAAGLAATQGLRIQEGSVRLFENDSQPGGILTAPGQITDATAKRLKASWEENHAGVNRGGLAVLGDGLRYERLAMTASDAQLIEQLKWSAEVVCSTFHVPPYKIGIGGPPAHNNVQALNTEYYSQCLQILIEGAEVCLDEGLEMAPGIGTEMDLDGLLRMDSVAQIGVLKDAVGAALMTPDEARRKLDLPPVEGGNTPYLQQQNFSLSALARRDARPDPFAKSPPPETAPPAPDPPPDEVSERHVGDYFYASLAKALAGATELSA